MTDGDYKEEIARLRTEVEALTADNAALLEAIGLLTPSHDDAWKRDAHEEGCRAIFDAEEECRCDGAFILGKVAAAKSLTHPGAALLEQHREELASAARRHDTTRATMVVREEWHRKEVAELRAELTAAGAESAALRETHRKEVVQLRTALGQARKALVRAQNKGLENAAAVVRASVLVSDRFKGRIVEAIDALKEAE
jgi:hypothetical protein